MAEEEVKFTKAGALKTIKELKEQLQEVTDAKTIEVTKEVEVEVEVQITPLSTQSDELGKLAGALCKCQVEFQGVHKDSSGHGYNYADLNSVIQYAQPIFTKNGLSITQLIVSKMHGKTLLSGVRTMLMHESGQWIASEAYAPTFKSKMNGTIQILGVNTTYIRRYQYQAILGLATTDSDGEG